MENAVQELPDEEANQVLDEILEEDKDDDEERDTDETECTGSCAEESLKKLCCCRNIGENGARFALRVLEAMRKLQDDDDALLPTSSAEDIVDYVKRNYRDDGDLYAQVRTALKQVCSQGFVMELSEDKYSLIGTYAISVNQLTCAKDRRDCSLSAPVKKPTKRRRRGDDQGDCGCRNERLRRRRRVSTNQSRRSGRQQQDDEDCECSVVLTDEDDCGCEDEVARDASRRQTIQDVQRNERPVDEERQTTVFQEPLEVTRRNDESRRIIEDNRHDEIDAQNVDDIYAELGDRVPPRSNRRERELKEWIKRCQEECKRASRRNRNNN